jgi:hypothetical protein
MVATREVINDDQLVKDLRSINGYLERVRKSESSAGQSKTEQWHDWDLAPENKNLRAPKRSVSNLGDAWLVLEEDLRLLQHEPSSLANDYALALFDSARTWMVMQGGMNLDFPDKVEHTLNVPPPTGVLRQDLRRDFRRTTATHKTDLEQMYSKINPT